MADTQDDKDGLNEDSITMNHVVIRGQLSDGQSQFRILPIRLMAEYPSKVTRRYTSSTFVTYDYTLSPSIYPKKKDGEDDENAREPLPEGKVRIYASGKMLAYRIKNIQEGRALMHSTINLIRSQFPVMCGPVFIKTVSFCTGVATLKLKTRLHLDKVYAFYGPLQAFYEPDLNNILELRPNEDIKVYMYHNGTLTAHYCCEQDEMKKTLLELGHKLLEMASTGDPVSDDSDPEIERNTNELINDTEVDVENALGFMAEGQHGARKAGRSVIGGKISKRSGVWKPRLPGKNKRSNRMKTGAMRGRQRKEQIHYECMHFRNICPHRRPAETAADNGDGRGIALIDIADSSNEEEFPPGGLASMYEHHGDASPCREPAGGSTVEVTSDAEGQAGPSSAQGQHDLQEYDPEEGPSSRILKTKERLEEQGVTMSTILEYMSPKRSKCSDDTSSKSETSDYFNIRRRGHRRAREMRKLRSKSRSVDGRGDCFNSRKRPRSRSAVRKRKASGKGGPFKRRRTLGPAADADVEDNMDTTTADEAHNVKVGASDDKDVSLANEMDMPSKDGLGVRSSDDKEVSSANERDMLPEDEMEVVSSDDREVSSANKRDMSSEDKIKQQLEKAMAKWLNDDDTDSEDSDESDEPMLIRNPFYMAPENADSDDSD